MARTMTTSLKGQIEAELGPSSVVVLKAAINSTHTAFDSAFRSQLANWLGGVGEATAFESACTANTASATLQLRDHLMNTLEHRLRGRDRANELLLCIADGTVT